MIEGLTRKQTRQQIVPHLLGADYLKGTASGTGLATTLVDSSLRFGDDTPNGRWVLMTSGDNDGLERVIDDYVASTTTYTLKPALTATTANNDTYERFNQHYSPTMIHDAINSAISSAVGRFYVRKESFALHADRSTARFDIPSDMDMIDRIEHRTSVVSKEIHPCSRTFDETPDSNFTQTVDTEEYKTRNSLKLVIAAGASAGDVITDSIPSVNLSRYTHLEGWIKSNVALNAAYYKIHLDNGVVQADGNDKESLSMPAVSADTWTYFRLALANPEDDTAIVSIGIEMVADPGAHTLYFDDIKVVDEDSTIWARVPKHLWRIDKEAKDLILTNSGRVVAGYSLLKLSGGKHPEAMSSDSTVATIPESYIVAKATSLLLQGGPVGEDVRRGAANYWERNAAREMTLFPQFLDVRRVT